MNELYTYVLTNVNTKPSTIEFLESVNEYINALEYNLLFSNNLTPLMYWSDKLGQSNINKCNILMNKMGIVTTNVIPRAKVAMASISRTFYDSNIANIEDTKLEYKAIANSMTTTKDSSDNLVRTPSGIKATGLTRKGFKAASLNKFKYDTNTLTKYYEYILENLVYSMTEQEKELKAKYKDWTPDIVSYTRISKLLLDELSSNNPMVDMGGLNLDMRGRSVYIGLNKVLNPVSNKDMRALLITSKSTVIKPYSVTKLNDIYLFIAELCGIKASSWNEKVELGKLAYEHRTMPTNHRSKHPTKKPYPDVHELIWLDRIYNKLDEVFNAGSVNWDIPLELDMTQSLGGIIGVLLNDERLMDYTNMINPEELKDAWDVNNVSRNNFKKWATPQFYGSAATPEAVNRKFKLDMSKDEIQAIKDNAKLGRFAPIIALKNFVINNCNFTEQVTTVDTYFEQFNVEVNKFKYANADIKAYNLYDTEACREYAVIYHKVNYIPDYKRFSLFSQTLLVHNLDSYIINNIAEALDKEGEWVLTIHDALLVLPGSSTRDHMITELETLHTHRKEVLKAFFTSIGIDFTKRKTILEWSNVLRTIQQPTETIKFSGSVLK